MNGDMLENEIRNMLVELRKVMSQRFGDIPGISSSLHFRGLAIWFDNKEFIIEDYKGVLPPELGYLANGQKREY